MWLLGILELVHVNHGLHRPPGLQLQLLCWVGVASTRGIKGAMYFVCREEVAAAQQSLAALDAAAAAQERRQQQIAQRQAERAQRKQDAAAGVGFDVILGGSDAGEMQQSSGAAQRAGDIL
jgi:hypothetical protein